MMLKERRATSDFPVGLITYSPQTIALELFGLNPVSIYRFPARGQPQAMCGALSQLSRSLAVFVS